MDQDLARLLWHDCQLNEKLARLIYKNGLLKAKVPGMSNYKDLFKIYQRHQKAIWKAGNEYADDVIALPQEPPGYGKSPSKVPRKKANVLHLVATFPGAENIKQLSDIGSMLAEWAIEDSCFRVMEDKDNNETDPESAEYEDLWGKPPDVEDFHTTQQYDDSFVHKLNARLQE
jgi:hypothetical protein